MTSPEEPLSVAVLGALELRDHTDRAIPLAGRRVRRLVAALVVHHGQVVRSETLAETVFSDRQPHHPVAALHSLAARLRRSVGAALTSTTGGYALRVDNDAAAFEALLARADRASAHEAAELLGQASTLWRGPAYAEFLDLPACAAEARRLDLRRVDAVERRAEALLQVRRAPDAVAELEAVLREHPFRERAHAAFMRALYAVGCHHDALRHYTAYHRFLATELGLEPAPALRRLHHEILRHDLDRAGVAIAG